jgi:hypothetical protein
MRERIRDAQFAYDGDGDEITIVRDGDDMM